MTPIFKATVSPPPPHLSTPNEQREAVGLPRINEIEAERLPVFRQMIEIESKPKAAAEKAEKSQKTFNPWVTKYFDLNG